MGEIDHEKDAINEGIAECDEGINTAEYQSIDNLKGPILYRESSIYSNNVDTPSQKNEDYKPNDVEQYPVSLRTRKTR
jgi:hypothetical protein